jgi:Fe-Mn family superoxide dismutase
MSATKSQPSAAIVDALNLHFGGVEKFREKFSHNALAVFGRWGKRVEIGELRWIDSGWTWLVDNDGQLEIVNTSNAATPITLGPNVTPLLTLDVWEHAYYVDHQVSNESHNTSSR